MIEVSSDFLKLDESVSQIFLNGPVNVSNGYILPPEPPVTPRAGTISVYSALLTPSPYRAGVHIENSGDIACCQHNTSRPLFPYRSGYHPFLPGLAGNNLGFEGVPEPVIEYRVRWGVRQYFLFNVVIVPLVPGDLLAFFVEDHHHVIVYPDNCPNHGRPPLR